MPSVPDTCVPAVCTRHLCTSYTRHLYTSCTRHLCTSYMYQTPVYQLYQALVLLGSHSSLHRKKLLPKGGLRNLLKAIQTLSRLSRGQLHSLSGNSSVILPLLKLLENFLTLLSKQFSIGPLWQKGSATHSTDGPAKVLSQP